MIICYWPDGCWVHEEDLPSMTFRQGEYGTIELPDDIDEHTIDGVIFDEVGK